MHEIIADWWKNLSRPMLSPWYFLRVESPLCYVRTFYILNICKNCHFLTPLSPYKCLRNIWMVPKTTRFFCRSAMGSKSSSNRYVYDFYFFTIGWNCNWGVTYQTILTAYFIARRLTRQLGFFVTLQWVKPFIQSHMYMVFFVLKWVEILIKVLHTRQILFDF